MIQRRQRGGLSQVRDTGLRPWPSEELEDVACCPVCAQRRRTMLYQDLSDRVFGTAPGRWTLWRCDCCRAAYLDPRPTEASIGRAYRDYYTHEAAPTAEVLNLSGPLRRLALPLANGRLNGRLGYQERPRSRAGMALVPIFVRRDRELLGSVRFLSSCPGGRLLDVGCGGGEYLEIMRALGWTVVGVDPDPTAVTKAQRAGLDVRLGSLADAEFAGGCFEAVTLNHTIEHVHDPVDLLTECRRVLAPTGELMISTPNLDSQGHRVFGSDWLHLDPPRHIVIFTNQSLRVALERAGFGDVRQLPIRLRGATARASAELRGGTRFAAGARVRLTAARANVRALRDPSRAEEVTLLARPGSVEQAGDKTLG